jgi:hypothetical protein
LIKEESKFLSLTSQVSLFSARPFQAGLRVKRARTKTLTKTATMGKSLKRENNLIARLRKRNLNNKKKISSSVFSMDQLNSDHLFDYIFVICRLTCIHS